MRGAAFYRIIILCWEVYVIPVYMTDFQQTCDTILGQNQKRRPADMTRDEAGFRMWANKIFGKKMNGSREKMGEKLKRNEKACETQFSILSSSHSGQNLLKENSCKFETCFNGPQRIQDSW